MCPFLVLASGGGILALGMAVCSFWSKSLQNYHPCDLDPLAVGAFDGDLFLVNAHQISIPKGIPSDCIYKV